MVLTDYSTFHSGWIPNYDLVDLDLDEVGNVDGKMRKDLLQAHKLAAEKHDLAYFKQVLLDFQAAREADLEAKAEAKAAKDASKSKSKKRSKAAADVEDDENEDVEMADAGADLDVDGGASEKKPKSSKKRKAVADPEESSVGSPKLQFTFSSTNIHQTPQGTSSAKKLKFKPITTSTTKTANGATPKSTAKKDSAAKPSKSKPKKSATNGSAEKADAAPKEPELSPEEKRQKKEVSAHR